MTYDPAARRLRITLTRWPADRVERIDEQVTLLRARDGEVLGIELAQVDRPDVHVGEPR